MTMRNAVKLLGGVVAIGSFAAVAAAEPFCVVCEDPEVSYRCEVAGIDAARASGAGAQLLCISELAKSGNHSRCKVSATQPEVCAADELKVILPPDPELVPAPPPEIARPDGEEPLPQIAKPEPAPQEPGPPKTVEEMAKQTAKSSQQGLQKAGKAVSDTVESAGAQMKKAGDAVGDSVKKAGENVGSTAKKTWNCITSLFSDC